MTITYSPRVTRDGDDFLAEVAVWSDSPVPEYIFVGYFERHSDAYAAACEESTDCATRAAADAALAAMPMAPERSEDEFAAALEQFDATAEARADALDEDAGIAADGLAVCGDCYDSADTRRAYREALAQQGAAEDAARDAA